MRARLRRNLTAIGRVLYTHRLSAIVVIVLAILARVPLANIWDQLPDVQRSRTDDLFLTNRQFSLALAASVFMALALFVLGRQRSERSWVQPSI